MLVVRVSAAPSPPRRALRRPRPRDAQPSQTTTVPLTTATVITPRGLGSPAEARRWLAKLRDDSDAIEALTAEATAVVNAALHAQRTASLDPALADVSADHALRVRIGFGTGDGLADGRWIEAIEPPPAGRRRRSEVLRPQERVATALGGDAIPACEELLLRARADLDARRVREAALQLRVGLEALLAERAAYAAAGQGGDLAELEQRVDSARSAGEQALRGELSAASEAELAETLRICERVMRRRAAAGR